MAVSTVSATDNVTDEVVGVNDETDFVQANVDNQSAAEEHLSTNEENIISSSPGTFADLTNEIENATGELNLTRDYVFSNTDNYGIRINKEITINGNGFSINANNKQSVIVGISSNNVVLKNIAFVNFASYYLGGAMSWAGNNGTLINCSFENCNIVSLTQYESSRRGGGAVYWTGNDGTLINCSFKNCKVSVANKMSYTRAFGGAVYWTGDKGTLINCSFVNCSCSQNFGYPYGGAVYFEFYPTEANGGRANIINCIFENNSAKIGGAIYSELAYNKIDNSIFNNNNAMLYGGALYLKDNVMSVESSEGEFLGYRSIMSATDIDNCIFNSNVAKTGGAIYESNNGTIVYGSKFINNTATNESGAIYIINDYDLLSDCIFIDNKATNNGAAILWKGNDGSISSSIFINNSATKDSGIYIIGANNMVKDSVLFSNNQNPIIFAANYVVTANYNWWGNTIHNYNQQPTVPARVNVKNWLFMNFTTNTTSLKIGEIAAVNCDLTNLITSNGVISKYNAIDLPILNLTVISDNNLYTSIIMIGGLCEAKYVATHTPTGNLAIKYNTIEETFYFTIGKAEIQLNISDSAILKGNLLVTAPNNATGIVHIIINNKNYSANMTNGSASVSIKDLPLGRYLATTSFESDLYIVDTFNSYIDIKSSIDANNLTKTQDNATKFQAIFYDFDGNTLKNTKVTFMLNGGLQTATTDNKGVASVDVNFNPNTYEITSLNPVTDETKINKITITASGGSSNDNENPKPINDNQIDISSLDSGSGTIKLPNDASGTITLDIAGKPYNFNVVNGVCNVKLPELDNGVYGYIITYSGDAKYASFTKTGSIKVNNTAADPIGNTTDTNNTDNNTSGNTTNTTGDNESENKPTPEIVVPPLDKHSTDGSVAITLPNDATGTITLVVNGKPYSFPVVNGVAKVYLPDLNNGNYDYTITYSGDGKYSSFTKSANMTVNNIIPTEIIASGFNTVYNGGEYIVATLKDKDGNPMKYVKVTVKFSNGKTDTQTTNKKGIVQFSTNGLAPVKKYYATITFDGNAKYEQSTTTVKVKVYKATPKITAKAQKFKRSDKKKLYTIRLLTNQNIKMKYTKVYIKVNGKLYSAQTNKKGYATFSLKKLTKKGTYKAKIMYYGDAFYNPLTTKVKLTVK